MKTTLCLTCCAAVLTACLSGSTAFSQVNTPTTPANQPPANAQTPSTATNPKATMHVRASKLIGMNIQNTEGKGVGSINDLVVDADTGRIHYAAVTYGGFLGIGNKMFAVPFEAFQFRAARNNANDRVLVLDVTQSQLEGSVGFDEDNWPNFADESFTQELDRRYKVQRNRGAGVDINVNRGGVDVDIKSNPGTQSPSSTNPRP